MVSGKEKVNCKGGECMIFRALIENLLSLLPDNLFQLPEEALVNAAQWAYFINHYIPMDTFMSCLALDIGTWIAFAVISGILQLL